MKATLNRTPISHKKLAVVAGTMRRRNATEALQMLKLMPKKGAKIMYKLLASAIANAENKDKANKENLVIDEIIINKGLVMKRFRPVSRGRAHPYSKKTSNVKLTLKIATTEEPKTTTKDKAEKSAPKKSTNKATK